MSFRWFRGESDRDISGEEIERRDLQALYNVITENGLNEWHAVDSHGTAGIRSGKEVISVSTDALKAIGVPDNISGAWPGLTHCQAIHDPNEIKTILDVCAKVTTVRVRISIRCNCYHCVYIESMCVCVWR